MTATLDVSFLASPPVEGCHNPVEEICKTGEGQNEGVNDALQR